MTSCEADGDGAFAEFPEGADESDALGFVHAVEVGDFAALGVGDGVVASISYQDQVVARDITDLLLLQTLV